MAKRRQARTISTSPCKRPLHHSGGRLMPPGKRCGVVFWLPVAALLGGAVVGAGRTAPAEQPSDEAVAKLIARLGANEFRAREQATHELVKLGESVLLALRQAATAKTELEVKRRIELVVIRIRAASIEKLLRAYCARQGLARDKVESRRSALGPDGQVFRYRLAATPAKHAQQAPPPRYALVFVDPDTGNTYDIKPMPDGDGKGLHQRTFAIMRLMG